MNWGRKLCKERYLSTNTCQTQGGAERANLANGATMIRLSAPLLLGVTSLLFTPAVASAQFGLRGGPIMPGPTPVIVPSFNPFFYVPQYRYASGTSLNFRTMMGNFSFNTRQYYVGIDQPAWGVFPTVPLWQVYYYYYIPPYRQYGSYMMGGGIVRPDVVQAASLALSKAQREAAGPGARALIAGPSNYEKGGSHPMPEAGPLAPPDALRKALTASSPAEVASGEALNELLKEIVRVTNKGASGPSAYIPSLLLDDIRFAGSSAADLLNFARLAGSLPFPAAFDDPTLSGLRDELDKDFAAAAIAVQAGKVPESGKVAKLEVTFQRLQDAAGPVVKNLPFEEATAARRFLNRMASAIRAMKGNAANGLIDPKWAAEGLTVADLVKHMTRHKLLFGPAPRGNEEAYISMHRNLATYLFVLTQPKK